MKNEIKTFKDFFLKNRFPILAEFEKQAVCAIMSRWVEIFFSYILPTCVGISKAFFHLTVWTQHHLIPNHGPTLS